MENVIICIGRQYGSGGRYVGKLLAEELNIPCYDKELLLEASKESSINENVISENDEKPNNFMYSLFTGSSTYGLPINQQVFLAQFDAIRKLVNKGPCIVVGRCADYVLEDLSNVVSIFIHAPLEKRIERAEQFYGMDNKKAKAQIKKIDRKRSDYYNFYTNKKWGKADSYDLTINSEIGVEKVVEIIKNYIKVL